MLAKFVRSERLQPGIVRYWFEPESQIDYLAGQYTELTLPNESEKRWFTVASPPHEKLVSIITKHSEISSVFKLKLGTLTPGKIVDLDTPIGDFVLPKDKSINLIFVAAGIGITPVLSILGHLKEIKEQRNIQLIYIVRNEEDLIGDEMFRQYEMIYQPIVTNPKPSWKGLSGSYDADKVFDLTRFPLRKSQFFISGPQSLVEGFTNKWRGDHPNIKITMDYFPGYDVI